jgi:hypothetical protein
LASTTSAGRLPQGLYTARTTGWPGIPQIVGQDEIVDRIALESTFQKPNPDELKAWMESILSDDSGNLLTESIAELAQHFPMLEEVQSYYSGTGWCLLHSVQTLSNLSGIVDGGGQQQY